MKKNNNSLYFMIGIIVLVVGLLAAVAFMSKQEEKKISAELPTQTEYENAYKGTPTDFEYDTQPSMGKENAPIKLVEFGDFKCPYCKQWTELVFPMIQEDYIDKGLVEFYFVNLQFLAEDSYLAGLAGEIIYKQNEEAFWQYYKAIYANQGIESNKWATEKFIIDLVKENVKNIDYAQFEKDLKAHKFLDEVRKDYVIAKNFGVNGTPAVFVNGVQVDNSPAGIKAAIDEALKSEGK